MSLDEIVAGLQQPDARVQLAAAQSARKIVTRQPTPPIDSIIEAGMVPHLVACLTRDEDVPLQFEACWALANITYGTSKQTRTVVEAGAIPTLVHLLSSPDVYVSDMAVSVLGNIAGDHGKLRNLVIDHGIMKPLLSLVTPDASVAFRRNITWTLSGLCHSKQPGPPFEVVKECLPALSALIADPDPETVTYACWALCHLTEERSNEQLQAVLEAGVVPRLVEVLRQITEAEVCLPLIRTIGAIATGDDAQTQTVFDAGALAPLRELMSHEIAKVREAVWLTISNLCAGNVPQIEALIEAGIIEDIIRVLDEGNLKCRREAAFAMTNLTAGGSVEQIFYIVRAGIITPICNLLTIEDPKVLTQLLETISNIFGASERLRRQGSICASIERCGGLDRIEYLRDHRNEDVRRAAESLFYSYFDRYIFQEEEEEEGIAPFG